MAAGCSLPDPRPLLAVVCESDYAARVLDISLRMGSAANARETVVLLQEATVTLGAESALFVSYVADGRGGTSCRISAACDPHMPDQLDATNGLVEHPWLRYASGHQDAAIAEKLPLLSTQERSAMETAKDLGFVSTALVPTVGRQIGSRGGLLCLGSARPGYFDDTGFARLQIMARVVAYELNAWWVNVTQAEMRAAADFSAEECVLLAEHLAGRSSKQIAPKVCKSTSAVNSCFQRLAKRLGVDGRRGALEFALYSGALDDCAHVSPSQTRIARDSDAASNVSTARTGRRGRSRPTDDS
jgi:hypothetical protein